MRKKGDGPKCKINPWPKAEAFCRSESWPAYETVRVSGCNRSRYYLNFQSIGPLGRCFL